MKILYFPGQYPFCYYYRGYLPGVYSDQSVVKDFLTVRHDVSVSKIVEQAKKVDWKELASNVVPIKTFEKIARGEKLGPGDYLDLIGVGDFAKAARPYLANPAIGIPALGYGAYEIGRLPGRLTDSGYEIEGGEEEKFIKDFGGEILGKETSTGEAITGYYLTKNQKRVIEIDKNYIHQFVKVSNFIKTKKENLYF